jgi:hypothetical protein
MISDINKNKIINACILAPSADNSQPFKFQWTDNKLNLYIDRERSGKASDNRFILSDIAMGAVIENACIMANSMGFKDSVFLFPNKDDDLHVAVIIFVSSLSSNELDDSLFDQIPLRHTDRRFPFIGDVTDNFINNISSLINDTGSKVTAFNSKNEIKDILPTIEKAEKIRFESKILHNELFSTVNFNKGQSKEGMSVSELAIEKFAIPVFKLIKNWKWMNRFNSFGASSMMAIRSVRIPILLSPCLLLVSIKNKNRDCVVNGGRAMQRIWLKSSKENYSIQPYAAPGVMSFEFAEFEDNFKDKIKEIGSEMNKIADGDFGLIFLRIGKHKDGCTSKTGRRNINSFKR